MVVDAIWRKALKVNVLVVSRAFVFDRHRGLVGSFSPRSSLKHQHPLAKATELLCRLCIMLAGHLRGSCPSVCLSFDLRALHPFVP